MNTRLTVISTFMIFMLAFGVSGQDATKIGVENGDAWDFKVTDGSWEYTQSGDTMTSGDEYEFSITSDVSSSGAFEYVIDGPDAKAAGNGDLGDFGSDAVFTDWSYWETNAGDSFDNEFGVTGTSDVTNGDSEFHLIWKIVGSIDIVVDITYYKANGILKTLSISIDNSVSLAIENTTGSTAKAPGFGFILALGALVAVPVIRKRRG